MRFLRVTHVEASLLVCVLRKLLLYSELML